MSFAKSFYKEGNLLSDKQTVNLLPMWDNNYNRSNFPNELFTSGTDYFQIKELCAWN